MGAKRRNGFMGRLQLAAHPMPPAPFTNQYLRRFRGMLASWYAQVQRTLPWRGESDPYRVLVSEIMLQQTRVAVVIERYKRFLMRFPSAAHLARAREQSVLAEWSGLGYYRRARSLQGAAKAVVKQGGFPGSAAELMELPGVGRYTAAAVASICFGEPVAVVDGNVRRVLDRLTGRELNEQDYWRWAGELLDRERPGDFNQAMMELGATVCLPRNPQCDRCSVTDLCVSRGAHEQRKQERRRKATLRYMLVQREDKVLLRQRPATVSLMPGMWELPETGAQIGEPFLKLRHSITVTDYSVLVYARTSGRHEEGKWIKADRLGKLALTGLTRKIFRAARTADR